MILLLLRNSLILPHHSFNLLLQQLIPFLEPNQLFLHLLINGFNLSELASNLFQLFLKLSNMVFIEFLIVFVDFLCLVEFLPVFLYHFFDINNFLLEFQLFLLFLLKRVLFFFRVLH